MISNNKQLLLVIAAHIFDSIDNVTLDKKIAR